PGSAASLWSGQGREGRGNRGGSVGRLLFPHRGPHSFPLFLGFCPTLRAPSGGRTYRAVGNCSVHGLQSTRSRTLTALFGRTSRPKAQERKGGASEYPAKPDGE